MKLHELIKSMSRTEKRYFKVNSTSKDSQKQIFLFEKIDIQKTYSEEKLLKDLKKSTLNFDYLAADKNYLYNSLLNSLANYHAGKSACLEMRDKLKQVEILFNKGLFSQALSIIKKCKKQLDKYELFSFIHEINRWEVRISGYLFGINGAIEAEQENLQSIDKLIECQQINKLYYQANLILQNNFTALIDPIMNHSLILQWETLQSNTAKIRALQTIQLCYFIQSDKVKEYETLSQILHLIQDQFSNFKKEYTYDYIIIYSRLLYLYIALSPEKLEVTGRNFIQLAEESGQKNTRLQAFSEMFYCNFSLEYMIRNNQYLEASQFKGLATDKANFHFHNVDSQILITTYYRLAYISFWINKLDDTVEYLNIISNQFDSKKESLSYLYAKILSLFTHYEMHHYKLLDKLLINTTVYLKKVNKLNKSHKTLLKMFRQLIGAYPGEKIAIYNEYQQYFSEYARSGHFPFHQYFDLKKWLNFQINEVSIECYASQIDQKGVLIDFGKALS